MQTTFSRRPGVRFLEPKSCAKGCGLQSTLVMNEHPRTGDIVYIVHTDDAQDAHGVVGGCYDDSRLPIGGSTHGGLSPYELHNVMVAYGPAFQQSQVTSAERDDRRHADATASVGLRYPCQP